MQDLSRKDILVRSQYLMQYIADFGYSISTFMLGGKYCEEDFKKLCLLNLYLDTLIYNLPEEETLAKGQIRVTSVTNNNGSISSITVNGVNILSGTITGDTAAILAENVADNINNTTTNPNYTAEYIEDGNYITITAGEGSGDSPNGFVIIVTDNGDTSTVVNSNMTGGIDGSTIVDVCLSNDQLETIFEHISELTGLCFMPSGIQYEDFVREQTEEEEDTENDILVDNTADEIVTNTGIVIATIVLR